MYLHGLHPVVFFSSLDTHSPSSSQRHTEPHAQTHAFRRPCRLRDGLRAAPCGCHEVHHRQAFFCQQPTANKTGLDVGSKFRLRFHCAAVDCPSLTLFTTIKNVTAGKPAVGHGRCKRCGYERRPICTQKPLHVLPAAVHDELRSHHDYEASRCPPLVCVCVCLVAKGEQLSAMVNAVIDRFPNEQLPRRDAIEFWAAIYSRKERPPAPKRARDPVVDRVAQCIKRRRTDTSVTTATDCIIAALRQRRRDMQIVVSCATTSAVVCTVCQDRGLEGMVDDHTQLPL